MQRHDVCTLDDFIDRQQIDLMAVSYGCVEKGIVGNELHPEGPPPECHSLPDTAKADDAESSTVQFEPDKPLAVPDAFLE